MPDAQGLTGYVAKNDMAKVPLLSLWMKRLYCLFINRDDVKEALKTILAGIDHIKNGISMCIFPEGTRNKTDDLMLPFKEGSFKMAEKTGCAIVPMAITGSADILENHFPKVKATHVILEYGKPIYPNELDKETKKKIGAHCQGVIEEMLVKNESCSNVRHAAGDSGSSDRCCSLKGITRAFQRKTGGRILWNKMREFLLCRFCQFLPCLIAF